MTESGYRVSRLKQSSQDKRKRRTVGIAITVVVLVLAVASLFIAGVIHWPSFGGSKKQSLSFLANSTSGQAISANSINILFLTYEDRDPNQPLTGILVASYGVQSTGGEFYELPTGLLAHTSDGKTMKLWEALKYGSGKTGLATSEVQRILGESIHYTFLLKETDKQVMTEALGLRTRGEGEFWSDYLSNALASLRNLKTSDLSNRAREAAGYFQRSSSFSNTDQQAQYFADMVKGFAALGTDKLTFRPVPGVEILNGCGAPGIGELAAGKLEPYGFAVQDYGRNAKKMVNGEEVNDFGYAKSVIYYHAADGRVEAYARYLQSILAVETLEFREDPVLGGGTITLVIGNDLVNRLATP